MHRIISAATVWLVSVSVALAQQQPGAEPPPPAEVAGSGEPISQLMFFTLGAALIIAVLAMVAFLRNRSNRDAAGRVFDTAGDEHRR